MKMTDGSYRGLVVANWVLFVATGLSHPFTMGPAPSLLEHDRHAALVDPSFFNYAPLVLLTLATLGLCLFRPWGRWLLVLTAVTMFASALLTGYAVMSPLQGFLGAVLGLLHGAILALAYFGPQSGLYERLALR